MCHKQATMLFSLLLLLCLGGTLAAQSGIDLRARIETGQWHPYRIAIGDFGVAVDSLQEPECWHESDSLRLLVKRVVTEDLDFHVFFDTVSVKQFYLDVWEITEITPLVWFRMGAEYLVDGTVELDGDDLIIEYFVTELLKGGVTNELKRERLKSKADNYRRIAHIVANEVVLRTAAEEPFFTTKIAFVSKATGHKEIYVCDYDGANVKRLTADQTINLSPAWDRREHKILYTSYRRDKQQIWELDIRSGKTRLVSNYPASNNAAAVSPDNKELLVSLSKDGNAELYILDRDGKTKRRLTRIPSIEVGASWAPSGNLIAFQSDRSGSPQVYTMDPEGLNVQRLTFESNYNDSPDFSPKGDEVVFVSRGRNGRFQICTVDITGRNFTPLDQSGSNENPHWSPDGWHLVYCKRIGSQTNLYIMDRFGKRLKQITFDGKSSNPAWQPFND